MSEESGISYSFQMGTPTKTPPKHRETGATSTGGGPLVAVDQYKTIGVTGGILLIGLSTGAQIIVQPQVEQALQHCHAFRTLEGHARHLVANLPQVGSDINDVVKVLAQVRESGLFTTAEDLCRRINSDTPDDVALDRSKAFIITCDRPAAVSRLLESMLHNAKLGQQEQLYLVDDSREATNAAENREAVERFNLMSPTPMTYVGEAEQRQIIAHLESSLPEHKDAIGFLLDRSRWGSFKTYGRARTLCLLLSVGYRCVVMDDDVLCQALHADPQIEGASFSDGLCKAVFYPAEQGWRQEWRPGEVDPLLGHTRCLGLSLGRALQELDASPLQPGVMAEVSARPLQTVNANSPVLVTQSGSVGDSGTRSNAWLVSLSPDIIQHMLSPPDGLKSAWESRQCWLGFPRPTFIKRAAMSQVTGLDNRHDLPPYFPALRDEDELFGALVDFLFPDSMALEYDWAVPHLPLEDRQGNPQGDSAVPQGGLQLVSAWLSELRPEDASVSYSTRLQLAAARLRQLAEMSTTGLEAVYRAQMAQAQADTLQQLQRQLADTGGLDEQWKAYLETNAQHCVAALQAPARLTDLQGASGVDKGTVAGHIRSAAAGYAAALNAWPAIRVAAGDIHIG